VSDTTNGERGSWGGVNAAWLAANPYPTTYMSIGSAIYRSGAPYLYDPDAARLRDPNVWTTLMRDDAVRPAWEQRLAKVVRKTWRIDPANGSPEAAMKSKIIESMLRGVDTLDDGRAHLAHADMWGYSPVWIEGRREWSAHAGRIAEFWTPTALRPLDIKQVVLKAEVLPRLGAANPEIVVRPYLATLATGRHLPIIHPECLILLVVGEDTIDRKGYGRGLDEPLYDQVWRKGVINRIGLMGFEKWSQGITDIGVSHEGTGTPTQTNEDIAAEHYAAAARMRDNGLYVHDKRDEVKILQPGSAGQDAYGARLAEINANITRLILGSVLPTGHAEDVGSAARAGEEGETTDDLLDRSRMRLDNVLTRRLVRMIDAQNEPAWAALGLLGVPPGTFSSTADENEDPEKFGRVVESAQKAGLEIAEEEAYRRFGLRKPADNEAKIKAPAPTISGFGGGFGGDMFGDAPPKPGTQDGAPRDTPKDSTPPTPPAPAREAA
jgi:hypothetical protein